MSGSCLRRLNACGMRVDVYETKQHYGIFSTEKNTV